MSRRMYIQCDICGAESREYLDPLPKGWSHWHIEHYRPDARHVETVDMCSLCTIECWPEKKVQFTCDKQDRP